MVRFLIILIFLFSLFIFLIQCDSRSGGTGKESVPSWAKQAVWYQIFPERFRNGDRSNDPDIHSVGATWPYLSPAGWQPHPWGSDWYKMQTWESGTGEIFYISAGMRRYGGDLQGVMDQLDYLADLGISAIYFNPLFESPSHHKYDATLYHHIDNNFGPDPAGDIEMWEKENPGDPATWEWTAADRLFLRLIDSCHARNMRVIIDGVFNHVGHTFWAFQDVQANQQHSAYRDWFIIQTWDDPATPVNEFQYQGWNGVRELPEIWEDENGLAPGFSRHIHDVVRRWMDPNGDGDPSDGIDGWRLDVAEKISRSFWKDFHRWVKSINPEAYLVGEIWWEDWGKNKMFNAEPWLQGDIFDGVMNYRWTRAVNKYLVNRQDKITSSAFADSIRDIMGDCSVEHFRVSQNLVSSHDVERAASQIVNPDRWLDHGGNPAQDRRFRVEKPDAEGRARHKLIVGLQMTMPGAPMIYYGDEAGMWGGDDPDCRKPMVWRDMVYEPESSHPFGLERKTDPVVFDEELFAWYRKMIHLRKNHDIFSLGTISFLSVQSSSDILCFSLSYQDQIVLVAVNPGDQKDTFKLSTAPFGNDLLRDLLTDQVCRNADLEKGWVIEPYEIVVLTGTRVIK